MQGMDRRKKFTSLVLFLGLIVTSNVWADADNALGLASKYNLFVQDDFTSISSDVQGALAAGGDVTLDSYGVASTISTDPDVATLIVGGDLVYGQGKIFTGSGIVSGSIDGVNETVIFGLENGATLTGNTAINIEFDNEFTQLSQLSADLAQVEPTGTVVYQYGGIYLTGDCQSQTQVFDLDGGTVLNSNHITLDCVPPEATLIFNISGTVAGFKNIGLSQFHNRAPKTLYNFHQATSVQFTWVGVEGSVLAPLAHIDNPRGQVNGTVIAKSWNGPMELHDFPFTGDLDAVLGNPSENTPPVAASQNLNVNEDEALNIVLNATDADSSNLVLSLESQPTNGVLSGTAPNLVYTPNADFNGVDAFTFKANDGELDSNTATISIDVSAVNDLPVATDVNIQTTEDISVDIELLGTDIENDVLIYTIQEQPDNGVLNGSGSNISYTPNSNFNGTDVFTYVVSDGTGDSESATVTITISPENDIPLANSQTVQTDEDTSLDIVLTGSDLEGDALTFVIQSQPVNGVLSGSAPNLTYTPNVNFNGIDSFTFKVNDGTIDSSTATVSITVNPVNDVPVIAPIDELSLAEDTELNLSVPASDVDGDALTYTIVTNPANGSLSGNGPNFVYAPNNNFVGMDSFSVQVSDDTTTSDIETISINIENVNDNPISESQEITTLEDTAVDITLNATDIDQDTLTYVVQTQPTNGVLSGVGQNLVYTPNENFNGSDSFTFVTNDGTVDSESATVAITVTPVNDAPVLTPVDIQSVSEDSNLTINFEANDVDGDTLSYTVVTQPTNGTLSGNGPEFVYTPNNNYVGTDSFSVQVSDGTTTSDIEVVSITIVNVNDAPLAESQILNTQEDTALNVTLAASDIEGDTLSFTISTQPVNGLLTGSGQNLVYTPNENFNGVDQFTFTANDGVDDSNIATVNISVDAVNDAPLALAQMLVTDEDTDLSIVLSGTDIEGDILSYQITSQPSNGSLNGNGESLVYTPNENFNGNDSFEFIVNDGVAASLPALINVAINPINDAPVAESLSFTTSIDNAVEITLIGSDLDNDSLTYNINTQPSLGSLSVIRENVVYTPGAGSKGLDTFTYTVNDGFSESTVATVTIFINSPPEIISTPETLVTENSVYQYDVDAIDANNSELIYSLTNSPTEASIDNSTGLIEWPTTDSITNGISGNDNQCIDLDKVSSAINFSDVILAVDESGSMKGEQEWLSTVIPLFDAHLNSNDIGNDADGNLYGLVGFTAGSREIPIGDNSSQYGTDIALANASTNLSITMGGTEDGWQAIDYILDNYQTRPESIKNIIIITDEGRSDVVENLTQNAILDKLDVNNTVLNFVVNATFTCTDGREAIGIDKLGNGILMSDNGFFESCDISNITGDTNTEEAYINLAKLNGGTSWSLNNLREGGESAAVFTRVFSQFLARSIKEQLVIEELSDLLVNDFSVLGDSIEVNIKNRGLAGITDSFKVNIYSDEILIAEKIINEDILSGAERNTLIPLNNISAELKNIKVELEFTNQNVKECHSDNNSLQKYFFNVSVENTQGLSSVQNFYVSVINTNEAPRITSNPDTQTSIFQQYTYQVIADDPDLGDSLVYSLLESPIGMSINEYTGEVSFEPNNSHNVTNQVSILVTDLNGLTDSQDFNLIVSGTDYLPPKFSSLPPLEAVEGTTYKYVPAIDSDPTGIISYKLFDAPAGMSLDNSSGELTWAVPNDVYGNEYLVNLQVEDQFGNYDIQSFIIFGDVTDQQPLFKHERFNFFEADQEINIAMRASDVNINESISFESIQAPDTIQFESVTDDSQLSDRIKLKWSRSSIKATNPGYPNGPVLECGLDAITKGIFEPTTHLYTRELKAEQLVVGPLYDSNSDNVLDQNDRIVVAGNSFQGGMQVLDAITGDLIWKTNQTDLENTTASLMMDLDADRKAEFVSLRKDGYLQALSFDGELLWVSDQPVANRILVRGKVIAADLSGNGDTSIIFGPSVFSNTGEFLWQFPLEETYNNQNVVGDTLIVDLNGDGVSEIVYHGQVRDHEGNLLFTLPQNVSTDSNFNVLSHYYAAVNIDSDLAPEIIVQERSNVGNYLRLIDDNQEIIFERNINTTGPITVGDFIGNSGQEIYQPARNTLFDLSGEIIWQKDLAQKTRHRDAAIADIDQNGSLDIVLFDSAFVKIIAGNSGNVIYQERASRNAIGTPVIVDEQSTGSASIFIGSNSFFKKWKSSTTGWVTQNKVFAYKGQNLDAISANLQINNSVDVNKNLLSSRASGFAANTKNPINFSSDMIINFVEIEPQFSQAIANGPTRINVQVSNIGQVADIASIKIYNNSPGSTENLLGELQTTSIEPNRSETLNLIVDDMSAINNEIFAVIDSVSSSTECNTENNTTSSKIITLKVTDSSGLSDTETWGLGIQESNYIPAFIQSPNPQPIVAKVPFEFSVRAEDSSSFTRLVYRVQEAPRGMSLSQDGILRWTPDYDQVGTHQVWIYANDRFDKQGQRLFTIRVLPSPDENTVPSIDSEPLLSILVGDQYSYQVNATDPDGENITYSLDTAPTGMAISSLSGEITWVPELLQVGDNNVIVKATDQRGDSDTQDFTVVVSEFVNDPPVITSTPEQQIVTNGNYSYQVIATDPDGDDLTYELTNSPAGMSVTSTGLITWIPDVSNLGLNNIVLVVTDIVGNTATQNYDINVIPDNLPPQFTTLLTQTEVAVGVEFTYAAQANDPDGDVLSFSLTQSPAGMTVNPVTGLVTWIPVLSQIGTNAFTLQVTDPAGLSAVQAYTLTASVLNVAPAISSIPATQAKTAINYNYAIQAIDSNSDILIYSLATSPTDMSIDASTGVITWLPTVVGEFPVTAVVSDGELTTQQSWIIRVSDSSVPLSTNINLTPRFIDQGESTQLTVSVTGAAGNTTITATLDGAPLALDANNQALITGDVIGEHIVAVTVNDGNETVTSTESFFVRDPNDTTAPVVDFITPIDGAEVQGLTDLIASVSDDNLAFWELRLASVENSTETVGDYTVISTGTTELVSQVFHTFDPSMLLNGIWKLDLVAFDANGNGTGELITVKVDSDLKVGNFSISFEDFNLPVTGIPVTLTRTYDSRRRFENLDFGYGWSVDYQNVRLQENRVLGEGWNQNSSGGAFPTYCVDPSGAHFVTVTLPDGRVEEFDLDFTKRCQQFAPLTTVTPIFKARPNTFSTLVAENVGELLIDSATGALLNVATLEPYDVDKYTLTTVEGYVYELDQDFGITSVTDTNGNTLSFSETGVVHSNGEALSFTRDTQGRITEITAPDNSSIEYFYDEQGDLVSMIDQIGLTTQFTYNNSHGLLDIIDPRGVRVSRNEYDDDGRLIATIDAEGNRIEYTRDITANTEQVKDRRGFTTTYVYDNDGNVLTETNALGETITRTYDDDHNELTVTDALGNTTINTFDANDNQLSETDPLGHVTEYTYDDDNQLLTLTDAAGNVVASNVYDNDNNLTSLTDALNQQTQFAYDVNGNLTQSTDALGQISTMVYDAKGYKISETDVAGIVTNYTYDDLGRNLSMTTTRTDANGVLQNLVTAFEYDLKGRLLRTTDPLGNITSMVYNEIDKPIIETDANGNETRYEYDVRGNKVKAIYADLSEETWVYDRANNLTSQTDRAGYTTSMEYDAANRLVKTTYEDNSFTTVEYDLAGRQIATVDARGNRTEYVYDAASRNTQVTDALGNVTSYVYDSRSNRVSMTDANAHIMSFTYDDLSRVTTTTYHDATTMSVEFDALGRKTKDTDQAGMVTQYAYDERGNLIKVTDALLQETAYGYDEQSNKLTQTDAEGRTTTWNYDNLGRVVGRTLPEGQSESMTYDAVGNMTSRTDFNGAVSNYSYNNLNQNVLTTYADGTSVASEYTLNQLMLRVTEERGVTQYAYDNRDRMTMLIYPNGQVLEYQYDLNGNRTQLTASTGTVGYSFDVLNRLQTVEDGDPVNPNVTSYVYDNVGNRLGVNHANGNITSYIYDDLNRLTNITVENGVGAVINSHTYTLAPAGQRTSETTESGRVVTYTYDDLYRLTQESTIDATVGNRTTSYVYDMVGNRLSQTENGVTTTYTYNDTDQLLTEVKGADTTIYTYDINGNTLTKTTSTGVVEYTYDSRDRLLTMNDGIQFLEYEYDASGIRQAKSADGVKESYLVDPLQSYAQVIAHLDELGNALATYTYGLDRVSQTIGQGINASSTYYHFDGLGSTRLLSDASGAVTDAYTYKAFGEVENKVGSTPNDYLFTGEQFDANLGFYYLRARYYNPMNGRFHSLDTYQGNNYDPKSLHKYMYANASPMVYTDPTGHFGLAEATAVASIVNVLSSLQIDNAFTTLDILGVDDSQIRTARTINRVWAAANMGFAGIQLLRIFTKGKFLPDVRFGPATGEGPLSATVRSTFRSSSYTQKQLKESIILYRAFGGKSGRLGPYWTRVKPKGKLQNRNDSALLDEFGNLQTNVAAIRVPKGAIIYEGKVAAQVSEDLTQTLLGGGNQVYIPRVDPAWYLN